MSHTMILWKRMTGRRGRKETQFTESQFCFMYGMSTRK